MTYALLSIAFVLFIVRGFAEYVVTATGAAPGWRLPSWISRERDDARAFRYYNRNNLTVLREHS